MPGAWWQSPILQSVIPVIEGSHSVHLHLDEIERVANWMAAEEWQPLDAPAPANADVWFTMLESSAPSRETSIR